MSAGARRPLLLGLALGCVGAVAGCGVDDPAGTAEAAEHVGTYEAYGEGGDGALLEGTVRVVDGCFVVEDEQGARHLPFFPDDEVTWSDARLRYGDESYGDGDVIALGGGASDLPEPMPASCRGVEDLGRWTVAQGG